MNKKELWRRLDAAIDNPNVMMAAMEMTGLVFNSADERRMIIVPRELLQEMIPESMRKA